MENKVKKYTMAIANLQEIFRNSNWGLEILANLKSITDTMDSENRVCL